MGIFPASFPAEKRRSPPLNTALDRLCLSDLWGLNRLLFDADGCVPYETYNMFRVTYLYLSLIFELNKDTLIQSNNYIASNWIR